MEKEVVVLLQLFDEFGALFHHDERQGLHGELLADQAAHPAEAADDVMVLEGIYHFFHLFPPDDALELTFEHDLGKTADQVTEDADSDNNENDGEYLARIGQVMNLFEPDGAEGNDGHVKGIEKTPPLDPHVPGGAEGNEGQKYQDRCFQVLDRVHPQLLCRTRLLSEPANGKKLSIRHGITAEQLQVILSDYLDNSCILYTMRV